MIRIEGEVNGIALSTVYGIYRDKYLPGYWVRTVVDGKTTKTYYEGLSPRAHGMLKAAMTFNQMLQIYPLLEKELE